MTRAERVVAAARDLIGTPFRLHGRDRENGLDCIGVAALAVRGAGSPAPVPTGYALRSGDVARMIREAKEAGLRPVGDDRPGTIVMVSPGSRQLHLVVLSETGFIHADMSLKRVVERPGRVPWIVLARWRLDEEEDASWRL